MSRSDEAPVAARSSFYLGMRILPEAQREAMYAVYSFCRAVDDIADGDGSRADRFAALGEWRAAIEGLFAGAANDMTAALAEAVRRFDLDKADFLAVVDGMVMDVERDITAPDRATFDLYCDRVAVAVGRLSTPIFGLERSTGIALAHHLGRALQMTNILRDLDEDLTIGRLYLPREALLEAGITATDPADILGDPGLERVCRSLADEALAHFDAATSIMDGCRRASVRAPRLMAAAYRPVLERLIAAGWRPPRRRVGIDKLRLAFALLRHGIL